MVLVTAACAILASRGRLSFGVNSEVSRSAISRAAILASFPSSPRWVATSSAQSGLMIVALVGASDFAAEVPVVVFPASCGGRLMLGMVDVFMVRL